MHPQSSQQCFHQLQSLLSRQVDQVNGYIDYLETIKDLIANNEVAQLDEHLASNNSRVEPIEQLQQQQSQLLIAQGFLPDDQGLQACIDAHDQSQQLNQLAETLTAQLGHLQKSLLINNLLIQKNQQRVRQSIRILSGHEASQQPETYSRKGIKSSDSGSLHSLAKA